jgi:hypothetical protein
MTESFWCQKCHHYHAETGCTTTDCGCQHKPKKRKVKPLQVSLPKITWFGMQQSASWLRQEGHMTEALEEAFLLFPRFAPASEDIRAIAQATEKPHGWLYSAYFGALAGDKSITVPPDQAKTVAALLRMVGFVMADTQRASTVLRRADVLEKIDVLDLMAGV